MGLLGVGYLDGDADRVTVALLDGQPVVAKRPGAVRKSEKGLVEKLGQRDRLGGCQPMAGGQRHEPRLAGDRDRGVSLGPG